MKTHKMPTEPDSDVRLLVPGSEKPLWWRDGPWGGWTNGEEECDWNELLSEYDEVMELEVPTEAVEFMKKYGVSLSQLYNTAPGIEAQKHLKSLIEFAEAFA